MTKQGTYKNKSYNLRISDEKREKLNYIQQKKQYKTLSNLLTNIIDEYIQTYEIAHGKIEIEEEESENPSQNLDN